MRLAVLDQKVGIADPGSPDAAADTPGCLWPGGVVNAAGVVAGAFDCFSAQSCEW